VTLRQKFVAQNQFSSLFIFIFKQAAEKPPKVSFRGRFLPEESAFSLLSAKSGFLASRRNDADEYFSGDY
jgi:hypothetical protein